MNNNNLTDCLIEFKDNEYKNMEKEKKRCRDQCYAFSNLGGLGEELALNMYPDYIGSASKGGCAFDLKKENEDRSKTIDAKEIKMISLDGSKECKKCLEKIKKELHLEVDKAKINKDTAVGEQEIKETESKLKEAKKKWKNAMGRKCPPFQPYCLACNGTEFIIKKIVGLVYHLKHTVIIKI